MIETFTGKDGIQIDSRVINDLADGDCVAIEFPNDLGVAKRGKNGNTIYAVNETGNTCELTIRLAIGSSDDKYLNSRMQELKADASKFILLTGVFSKRVGDGTGAITSVVYECTGGVFKKQVGAKSNAEGDAQQGVVVYTITYGAGNRSIQ